MEIRICERFYFKKNKPKKNPIYILSLLLILTLRNCLVWRSPCAVMAEKQTIHHFLSDDDVKCCVYTDELTPEWFKPELYFSFLTPVTTQWEPMSCITLSVRFHFSYILSTAGTHIPFQKVDQSIINKQRQKLFPLICSSDLWHITDQNHVLICSNTSCINIMIDYWLRNIALIV